MKEVDEVNLCTYRCVWCVKYRLPILQGDVARQAERAIRITARKSGVAIMELSIEPDQVNCLVAAPSSYAPAAIVAKLKAGSAGIRLEFPHLRSRLPALWTREEFCATIGSERKRELKDFLARQPTRSRAGKNS
jgi:putative transposase